MQRTLPDLIGALDKPEYVKCSDQIWKSALPRLLTPETLPVVVKLMILEYSEVNSVITSWILRTLL